MKSLACIVAEVFCPVNESNKNLLELLKPLMTTFKVNGEDDQQIYKNGLDLKRYIETLRIDLEKSHLKSTAMAEAEIIISEHSLRDKKVQIALYAPIETTYYAHYNDTGRNAICGVNPFGPDNGGSRNPIRYDIPVEVAKELLRANGCKY